MILVDTNIFIDLLDDQNIWQPWSKNALIEARLDDRLVINHIVLAELNARPDTAGQVDRLRQTFDLTVQPYDDESARRAGEAHGQYRRDGGLRTAILADFLIGAHALTLGAPLITRDAARFAGYFPELALITPETHP